MIIENSKGFSDKIDLKLKWNFPFYKNHKLPTQFTCSKHIMNKSKFPNTRAISKLKLFQIDELCVCVCAPINLVLIVLSESLFVFY